MSKNNDTLYGITPEDLEKWMNDNHHKHLVAHVKKLDVAKRAELTALQKHIDDLVAQISSGAFAVPFDLNIILEKIKDEPKYKDFQKALESIDEQR